MTTQLAASAECQLLPCPLPVCCVKLEHNCKLLDCESSPSLLRVRAMDRTAKIPGQPTGPQLEHCAAFLLQTLDLPKSCTNPGRQGE